MNFFIWLILLLIVFFALAAFKILSTTEFHGVDTPKNAKNTLDIRHTISSIIFYPIGFTTFIFGSKTGRLGYSILWKINAPEFWGYSEIKWKRKIKTR